MNYYEHHIGDYAQATAHLSFVEDAAYSRLIRKYYAEEKPLPANIKTVQRLVGARTKEEKIAVQTVLEEFFYLTDDGWRQERCDRVIADFQDGEPEREIKKANEETRLRRHREERSSLFSLLNQAGQHAPWNLPIGELRALAQRCCNASATLPATPATAPETLPATAPATPATATQTPDTRVVNPISESSVYRDQPLPREEPPPYATRQGELCKKLRSLGIDAAPHLAAWATLLPGYSDEEILAAAESAREKKPGGRVSLNYLVPMLADRKAPKNRAPPPPRPEKFDPVAYVNRNRISRQGTDHAPPGNIIDISAESVA